MAVVVLSWFVLENLAMEFDEGLKFRLVSCFRVIGGH